MAVSFKKETMAVRTLMHEALLFCRKMADKRASCTILDLRQGNRRAHSTLRYAIARIISNHMASISGVIKAVYVFGSTMEDKADKVSDIDMIVIVKKKDKFLDKFFKGIDSALLYEYKKLVGNGTSKLKKFLDINVVDENDLADRTGYASVINSMHKPAVKIQ